MKSKLLIAALVMCQNAPAKNAANSASKSIAGETTTPGGGGSGGKSEQLITPAELMQLREQAALGEKAAEFKSSLDSVNSRIGSFRTTLENLGLIKENQDALSVGADVARELNVAKHDLADNAKLVESAEKLQKTLETLFPKRCNTGETVLGLAEKIVREHAEKCEGKPAAGNLVEGCSAIDGGDDGKGVQSVYVIGVSVEREEVVIYGTTPRIIPLKRLKPVRRGLPISDSERKQRADAWPDKTWDTRED